MHVPVVGSAPIFRQFNEYQATRQLNGARKIQEKQKKKYEEKKWGFYYLRVRLCFFGNVFLFDMPSLSIFVFFWKKNLMCLYWQKIVLEKEKRTFKDIFVSRDAFFLGGGGKSYFLLLLQAFKNQILALAAAATKHPFRKSLKPIPKLNWELFVSIRGLLKV